MSVLRSRSPHPIPVLSSRIAGQKTRRAAKPANVKEAEEAEEASGKKKIGGDKPGWTDKRVLGKTHDNSI